MKVFFSHTGIHNLIPMIEIDKQDTYLSLVNEINAIPSLNGIKSKIALNGKVLSGARIFVDIQVIETTINGKPYYKYYEKQNTFEVSSLDLSIPDGVENILISIFDPAILLQLLNKGQAPNENGDKVSFPYIDEEGTPKVMKCLPSIDNIDFDVDIQKEYIYGFKTGETTLEELKIPKGGNPSIAIKDGTFNKKSSKLLPADMVEAIREIWDLPDGKGSLRLFQEDALFFIMSKLMKKSYPQEKQLLLSMPTGGGKTEAFMIPLLSHIYLRKQAGAPKGIKSVIIYPTNALANDQAFRFVEMLYNVNKKLSDSGVRREDLITIGILSGDTPNKTHDLIQESLIKICPRCGKSDKWDRERAKNDGILVCCNELDNGEICGTSLDFCKLRKEDIITSPPDILITNPDEINFALQSPRYLPLFQTAIESIIFDEVHIYQGVFGCHIAHLLRRLEETMHSKPLYIGMSATIGNAKELAALLFDEEKDDIKYIRNENNQYQTDQVVKSRLHALIRPYLRGVSRTRDGQSRNKYVRTMTVALSISLFVAHLIADSHFRKSIVFANYRADADDLAGYLKEREALDVRQYYKAILEKLENGQALSVEEREICEFMHQWSDIILQEIQNVNTEMEVGWNRGGLEKEERIRSIHRFTRNNIMSDNEDDAAPVDIMVATKSLEVGIDIGDVTTVINSSAPFTVNEYVQRVGRGGRKKDSLALTIINPENAIDSHLRKHFSEYVIPTQDSYEDAPIIINNSVIIERHVKARIADYWNILYCKSPNMEPNVSLQVSNVVSDVIVHSGGTRLNIGKGTGDQQAILYADALYEMIFGRQIDNKRYDDRLIEFIARETRILGTNPSDLTKTQLKDWIRELIVYFNQHLQPRSKPYWEINSEITGRNTVIPELSPTLRGSGATVSLFIDGSETDNAVDVVSRQSAFNSMPVASEGAISTTKSGVSTFRIVDTKDEPDVQVAKEMKRRIARSQDIKDYFVRKLAGFPNDDDPVDFASSLDIVVPRKLRVAYYPSRFYCTHCHRALIPHQDYEHKKNGVYCRKCGHKAQQLHKVYMCQDPDCGKLFDPPAPKMCMNPDCSAVKAAYAIYKSNGYRYKKEMLDCFRFRLTKDLEWVCETCGCKMNFSSLRDLSAHNSKQIREAVQGLQRDDTQSIEGMCYKAKFFPEVMNFSQDQLRAQFRCTTPGHRQIRTIGVPRVRTVSYSYVGNKIENGYEINLCEPVVNANVNISFKQGYVIQLANEFLRRFSSGRGDSEAYTLKTEKIYDHQFWGNYYESHLAWITFGSELDAFITEHAYSCSGDCTNCTRFEEPIKLDLAELMRPKCALEDYNFDVANERPKQPDLRGRFCEKAKCNECKSQWCVHGDGSQCEEFNRDAFLRYVLVHTLKHGILWALPKYAGVNVSEVKGEVYPDDHEAGADLVLIDSNEGGSGAILLLQKHWEQVWEFAREVIGLTATNEANVVLPHTCARNNADICPFIAQEFFEYIKR